jgi:alpha-ribazole phosphatase/probable phosphoglycerate mutase
MSLASGADAGVVQPRVTNQITRLVLARHAQPTEDARGRCYGALDVGLSPAGRRQARLLAATLSHTELVALYSSPSRRARDTAAPIAATHGLEPIIDERLSEIDFGEFEGRTYDELEHAYPELYREWMTTPTSVQFPGGESYRDLRVRALAAMETIRRRHAGQITAVVSHGGVLRAMLVACLQMPIELSFRLDQSHGAISIIDWVDTVPILRVLNAQPTTVGATRQGLIPLLADAQLATRATP